MRATLQATAATCLALWAAWAQGQTQPQWLTDAQARETPLPPATEVASEDGWLQARVPGTVRHKVVLDSGGYSLQIALSADRTISCEVLRGSRDLAALLAETAEISLGQLAKTNGEIEARVIEAIDAGALGAHPYMALRWVYRARRGGEARIGGLKQFAADLGEAVVYCADDELGYVKTFDAVARAVAESLRIEGKAVDTGHFGEISVITLEGQRVGVASTVLSRDTEGDTQVRNKGAMLLQRTQGQLISQDTVEVQWVRPDGSLINALQVKAEQGKLTEDVALRRHDDGRWRATGTLAGKDVDFVLDAAPSSYLAMAQARRQLMDRPNPVGGSTEATSWSSLDLSRLLPAKATVLAAAGPGTFAVREELGGVVIDAVLDRKTGTMASATIPLGALNLRLQRVHQHGSF